MNNAVMYNVIAVVARRFANKFKQYEVDELINEVYADKRIQEIANTNVLHSFATSKIIDFLRKEKNYYSYFERESDFGPPAATEEDVDNEDEAEYWLNKLNKYHKLLNVLYFWHAITYKHIGTLLKKHQESIRKSHKQSIEYLRRISDGTR